MSLGTNPTLIHAPSFFLFSLPSPFPSNVFYQPSKLVTRLIFIRLRAQLVLRQKTLLSLLLLLSSLLFFLSYSSSSFSPRSVKITHRHWSVIRGAISSHRFPSFPFSPFFVRILSGNSVSLDCDGQE